MGQMLKTATYLVVLVHILHSTFADFADGYVPYVVSLQKKRSDGSLEHYCGGSLISPSHILTTAYCCDGVDMAKVYVKAGVRDLKESGGQLKQAKWCNPHDNYTLTGSNNIAIIRVFQPFVLDGKRTATIFAENPNYLGDDEDVTLYGWSSSVFWSFSNILQAWDFETITNQQCKKRTTSQITNAELCVDTCTWFGFTSPGFSGSPLVKTTGTGVEQVGIYRYRTLFVPGVFTRTSLYTDCIKNIRVNNEQIGWLC